MKRFLGRLLFLMALLAATHAGLVRKTLRDRRADDNATLPAGAGGQPVVFNHVYNINVPALCSVDLDAPGNGKSEDSSEHTLDGQTQNQIVFTHRINIPRQACGCSDTPLPDLEALLSRLEVLEGEVSSLRDQCFGSAHVTGAVGTKPYCNGRGNYSAEACGCVCEPGWKGPNCTEPDCPDDCQDQGRCVDGRCVCFEGFGGEDCALQLCPVDCGDNGECLGGVCVCSDGFAGDDCSESDCLNGCLGRGRCVDGDCWCDEPWAGGDCSELICPNDCYDRGRCDNGTCHCDEGFAGEDCGERTCPGDCTGRGFCVDGECVCSAGYAGEDCSELTCLNDCSGRGVCFNGVCVCDTGYQGEDCSQLACLNNCHDRGQCVNGQCACDVGFQGDDCSELSCPGDCLGRGRCVDGQCVCDEGFAGEDCGVKTCPSDCHGRGECVDGRCACHAGFQGDDCGELSCPNNCLNRGRCVDGQCVCDEGFTGEDCGQKACLNDCLGRGYCDDGRCVCQEGFAGDDCSVLTCPDNCNGRGRCVDGKCACEDGYMGESCGELRCPGDCNDRGHCVTGQCVCDEGYIGEDCSEVSPPKNLSVTDVTTETVGLTWSNEMLVTEYLVTYVPTAPGGLYQEFTVPGDQTSATVEELEPGIEYLISVYAVLSNKRSIPVSARVATHIPQPEGLRFKSVRETSVEVLWDQLDIPFDGWELFFRNTKEENGKILNTLPSSQTQFEQSGLGPGQEYQVSIGVVKNNTRGPQLTKTFTTRVDGPQQVEVKDVTDSSALLTWAPPVAQVEGVTVSYGPAGSDPAQRASVELSPADRQLSLDGLSPDTPYQVTLLSRRGNMTSEGVSETFTTDLDPPRDLQPLSQTDGSVTLEWTNSQAEAHSYRVKYSPFSGGAHGEELFPRGLGNTTQATITGLVPGTEYGIGVTAVKQERESLPATTNAATDLDAPTALEVSESTETALTVAWRTPRARITGYRLVWISRDGRREELQAPETATAQVLNNLTPGTLYTVTLTAERGQRSSAPATVSAATASFTFYLAESAPDLTTPSGGSEDNLISFVSLDAFDPQFSGMGSEDEPGALTVSNVTSDGFHLSWEPQARAAAYDSYAVECRDALGLWDVEEVRLHGDATGTRIRGLNASTEYRVRLYGVAHSQRSSPSEAVVVTASTSPPPPDVLALSVRDAPTPRPAPGILGAGSGSGSVPPSVQPLTPSLSPPAGGFVSGAGPESSNLDKLEPGDLRVTGVTPSSVTLRWSAPDEAFDSFLVELNALSEEAQSHVTTVPGEDREVHIQGLSPRTRYKVTLYGMVEGGQSLPLTAFADTEELKPQVVNLNITDVTWDSFLVSWGSQDGDFDSFVIEVTDLEEGPDPESQNLTLSGDAFSLAIPGLRPNTSYMVGLYGLHRGSFLEPVYAQAATASEPEVGYLSVSNLTWESFSLSWNGTEGQFDGYILEIIDSDSLSRPEEYNISHNAMSYDITGLRPSTDYVAFLYGILKGSRTQAVSVVASTAAEPDLSRLVVSNVTSDRLALSWVTGRRAFDNFVVEVRESALPSQAVGRTLPGAARSTVMAGLKGSTRYDVKLYASSAGRYSKPLFAVVTTEAVPKLSPITVSGTSPNNLTLSWSTVAGHFDGFVVRVRDSEQQFDPVELRPAGQVQNVTVTGLRDATAYDLELYGVSHGRRTPSLLAHAVTEPLPRVENLTVSDITPFGFRVSWDAGEQAGAPPGGGFSRFQIVVSDSGWLLEPQEFTVPGSQSRLDIGGLITGIGYEVRLTGVSRSGLLSRPLTTVAATEAEPEVEHMFVSDVTDESFRLAWTADEDLFDRFVVKIRDVKKIAHPQEFHVLGDERTKVLTGLVGGTEYEIELYGVTLERRSQPIFGVARTGLGSPRGIRFSDVTDSSAVVHWALPGYRVDSYRVIYIPLPGGSPLTVTVDGAESQALLPNMAPGETYQVTVVAVKGLEESDPATDTVTTALDMPQDLTAVNVTDVTALLLWQPAVATIDGYVITYSADSAPPVMEHVSGNTVEFELDFLVPATRYTVGVYAMREAQKSGSATTHFTTDLDAPRDLKASNVQTDRATITWTPPRADITGYALAYASADGAIKEVALNPSATSLRLDQLTASTEYTVTLQAVAAATRSGLVTAVFSTTGVLYRYPRDCAQALLNGETTSGVYSVYLGGDESQPLQVYCDMTTNGGGWMVFLRRQSGKLEFYRNWKNYTNGFGDLNDEFWLGLSKLNKITSGGQYELRVDLRDEGETAYAQYDKFTISEPRSRYKVHIGAYSGTAGDSMTYHQGRPFSTYDNDNDIAVTNCALSYKGAFWYKNCHRVNLMGRFGDSSHSKGINWFHWKGHEHSIQFAEMKIRPVNFRNLESRRKRS